MQKMLKKIKSFLIEEPKIDGKWMDLDFISNGMCWIIILEQYEKVSLIVFSLSQTVPHYFVHWSCHVFPLFFSSFHLLSFLTSILYLLAFLYFISIFLYLNSSLFPYFESLSVMPLFFPYSQFCYPLFMSCLLSLCTFSIPFHFFHHFHLFLLFNIPLLSHL